MTRTVKSLIIIFLILIADQVLKIYIKTSMSLGDEIVVFKNWFILHFVENNGMAFGFEFAGEYGKMFLSIFRILAVVAIGWYLFKLAKQKEILRATASKISTKSSWVAKNENCLLGISLFLLRFRYKQQMIPWLLRPNFCCISEFSGRWSNIIYPSIDSINP